MSLYLIAFKFRVSESKRLRSTALYFELNESPDWLKYVNENSQSQLLMIPIHHNLATMGRTNLNIIKS